MQIGFEFFFLFCIFASENFKFSSKMIQISRTDVGGAYTFKPNHFPDGTQMILDFPDWLLCVSKDSIVNFTWHYENDEELLSLIYLKRHIENTSYGVKPTFRLYMPYIPNARMDRVKYNKEVFTLKYFCEIINSLNFDKVYVMDAHSDVSVGLLNNCVNQSPVGAISCAMSRVLMLAAKDSHRYVDTDLVIYFPDEGACKRYSGNFIFEGHEIIVGRKNRDWNTGKILGLEICDRNGKELGKDYLHGKIVLMVDDIISYGGTMAYSAEKLRDLGATYVYAYATHTENSIADEDKGTFLKDWRKGIIDRLFTTDSIPHKDTDLFRSMIEIV